MGTPSLSLNITADTDSMILTTMKHFKTSGSSRIDPQLQIQNFSEHMTTCIWKSIICFINISNISQILSAVFKKILIESIFQHFSAQVG